MSGMDEWQKKSDAEADGFKPGTLGCHEALHMASYFAGAVDEELCEHPAIKRNPKWLALATKAADALGDLYNAIGRDHLTIAPSNGERDAP